VDGDRHRDDPRFFYDALREWLPFLPNLKKILLVLRMRTVGDESDGEEEDDDDSDRDDEDSSKEGSEVSSSEDDEEESDLEEAESKVARIGDRWVIEELVEAPAEYLPLPPLPHLETIVVPCYSLPSNLVNGLVFSYAQQIKKMCLPIQYWKPEYSNMFPNLTQFELRFIQSIGEMNTLLLSIQAPLLYELHLWADRGLTFGIKNDIFPWLKRFSHVRNLSFDFNWFNIGFGSRVRGNGLSPAADSIPSVKYLQVGQEFLHANTDFLLCFPNLEYLRLSWDPDRVLQGTALEPKLKIWEFIGPLTIYESNIWELLPKLRGLTVLQDDDDDENEEDRLVYFNRENYEHEMKLAAAN